ncbi:MAG: HPr family phosphocarrier protein [Oscillospiraceae bacterium]|nr:HPr family phosphocarrier protein [Oscillospiraceae bacterium]
MQEIYVRANSFQDVKAISAMAAKEEFQILISDGRRTVNAKSLLGIFSLDVGRPLLLRLDCGEEDCEAFRVKAGRYVVD